MDLSKLFHGFLWVVTWICQNWYMDFFEFGNGFVKIVTWISLSRYLYLSKLLYGFVKLVKRISQIVLCISRLLPNKTNLKYDQDFRARWSFCFKLKVLHYSKYSILSWCLTLSLSLRVVLLIKRCSWYLHVPDWQPIRVCRLLLLESSVKCGQDVLHLRKLVMVMIMMACDANGDDDDTMLTRWYQWWKGWNGRIWIPERHK